jgi:aspartyl-tRNA(Asn)/glutamyl-tRNA(Gln) amidotransferase subunit C
MTQSVSLDEVRHIAQLSRLQLSEEELARFAEELGAILGYVNQLAEVNVEGVEPTAHAVATDNVFRAETVQESPGVESALANAPERQDAFFRVPKVLNQDPV